ncbi:MAG: NAD(+)/NADH kinase [Candidatus Saccharicenans sp.]|nr:NAD(+)/NADH kinase [Candidatus Saccharicenans sp.]
MATRQKIKSIGLVIKPHAPGVDRILREIITFLKAHKIEPLPEKIAAEKIGLKGGVEREKLSGLCQALIVLGGDGTLLSIAPQAARAGIPVIGINLGRLGFLTEIPVAEALPVLEAFIQNKNGFISQRSLLEIRYGDRQDICLNDVVLNKSALARMIELLIFINDQEVTRLKGDGLILSSPTGSTAYSLSAGGPIVHPGIECIILTPICPHTLSFRPLLIPSTSEIKIKLLTPEEKVYLTIDGQRGETIPRNAMIRIKKSNLFLQLVTSPWRSYYQLVKEKLGWAE